MSDRPRVHRREVHLIDLASSVAGMTYSPTLGYLQAAAQLDPEISSSCGFHKHVFVPRGSLFQRACERVLAGMHEPFAVAFTIYFWNRAKSLEMARMIKERWPACYVILGGNDVSHQQDAVFAEAPWTDVLVHGEGELRFRDILRQLLSGNPDLSAISGVSYWGGTDGDRRVVTTQPAERVAELERIPSPILTDVYTDAELAATNMVIYETNRGCPYKCAFCYWGGAINSKVRQFSMERIAAELDRIVRCAHPGMVLFFADANFGMLPRDPDIARLLVELSRRYQKKIEFFTSWAKNTNRRVIETAKVLHDAGLLWSVTVSAQSFDPTVLQLASRTNLRVDHFRNLHEECRLLGIPTYTELIWGMPGESYETFKKGIEEVIAAGGSPVIYPLQLLNNTEYTHDRFRTEHGMVTRRMPFDITDPEIVPDLVVSHARMTEEEWVRGLELRLCVSLFQKGMLRCTLRLLHVCGRVPIVEFCDRLVEFLTSHCSDPFVSELARNHRDTWRQPDRVDWKLIEAELGADLLRNEEFYPTELHYQALLHHLVRDASALRKFLSEATEFLCSTVPSETLPNPGRLAGVNEIDLAAAAVFRAQITGVNQSARFRVPADTARLLREAGDLPADLNVTGDAVECHLTSPDRLLRGNMPAYSFSRYATLVWRGLAAPLRDAVITLADHAPPELVGTASSALASDASGGWSWSY